MVECTVLIVDDNPEIVGTLQRVLTSRGATVVSSTTPFGVSALISRHQPDAVVLDVMMPGLHGGSLAELLASKAAELPPIIFYSALPEEELHQLCRRLPGTRYVSKMDGPNGLERAITRAVEQQRVRDARGG